MDLRIIDTSNYIHVGASLRFGGEEPHVSYGVREVDGYYEENRAPIGGVSFLINKMIELSNLPDTIVVPVFDSTPTIKRQMYADVFGSVYGYKGTRKKASNHIGLEREFAKALLQKMEFPVQCIEGYEADDIIYTLTMLYKNDFDNVYIYTLDSDLSFLIDRNVSIKGITKINPKNINIDNYVNTVHKKRLVPYNTINIVKLCEGDKADNIPGVGEVWATKFDEQIGYPNFNKCGDLEFCRKCLIQLVADNPLLQNSSRVLDTFNLLVPLLVPEDMLETIELTPNKESFIYFKNGWNTNIDTWGFNDMLLDYINEF